MKLTSKLGSAFVAVVFSSASQAASVIGTINFTSGANGGVLLQDLNGNLTTNPAAATGIKSWLLPQVDKSSGSFVSVPDGQAVSFPLDPLHWIFDPSTPISPLWTIPGFGDFTFILTSSTIVLRDADFLLVSGIGTLTGTNFDPTPATWNFSTQGFATENKFSWSSSTTAVPEIGTPMLLGGAFLYLFTLRRRDLT